MFRGCCSAGFCLPAQEAREAIAATPAKGKNKFDCSFSINTILYKIAVAKIEDNHLFRLPQITN